MDCGRVSFPLALLAFLATCQALPSHAAAVSNATDERLERLANYSLAELLEVRIEQASFFPTTASKAPSFHQIIQLDPIERSPDRTLGEVFQSSAPGMAVSRHRRHGVILGVRGISIDNNAKTLVMLEGQQINQRVHFGTMIGLGSPLIGDLEKLELTLGPGAIVHGSGARPLQSICLSTSCCLTRAPSLYPREAMHE